MGWQGKGGTRGNLEYTEKTTSPEGDLGLGSERGAGGGAWKNVEVCYVGRVCYQSATRTSCQVKSK